MPTLWATKATPQMVAVSKRSRELRSFKRIPPLGFLYRLQTVGVGCLAPALCVPVPNGQGISPAAAGGNDAPARRGRARGGEPIRGPPPCQSPSFPSRRAARARGSDAFLPPPPC